MGAISALLSPVFAHPIASITATVILYILYIRYGRADLRTLPGPFLASITNLHRLWTVSQFNVQTLHIRIHKKHGPLVRLGPNLVSVSDPVAIPTIFGVSRNFLKSDFYPVQQLLGPSGNPVEGMFNTTSPAVHSSLRRPVAHMYSASALLDYEPLVDRTLNTFRTCIAARGLVDSGVAWDLGNWLQWFAFDVIGEMTFGRRLGFLEGAHDVEGVCASIEEFLHYSVIVGQMPMLDRILRKNRLARWYWARRPQSSYISSFALTRLDERLHHRKVANPNLNPNPTHADFLSKFLKAHEADARTVPRSHVISWTISNVFAGSDTTAITLRAIFYYLLRHPIALATLCAELETRLPHAQETPVSWVQSQTLPYLDAVIRESMRLHPVTGTLLERIVPVGGATICDHYLREGTIVGMTPWVVHRDVSIFGADVECFRPERWLECDAEMRKGMERSFLGFGAGTRTCVGKNISRLEMYKFVPEVLRWYELELEVPEREWRLLNVWFVKQTGLVVRIRSRSRVLGYE